MIGDMFIFQPVHFVERRNGKVQATLLFSNRKFYNILLEDFGLHMTRVFFFILFFQNLDEINWSKLNFVYLDKHSVSVPKTKTLILNP